MNLQQKMSTDAARPSQAPGAGRENVPSSPILWGAGERLSAVALAILGLWLAAAWALGWFG